jgi:integration host factor subunit beta
LDDRETASDPRRVFPRGYEAQGLFMTKHPTLTKADLIEEVLRISELPRKESETIVETIFDSIIESLQKGDKIEIRGFGSFRTRQRRGRIGRNPKTGAKVEVPPKKIPFFKPSKELKDFVNNSKDDGADSGTPAAAPAGSSPAPGNSTHS